MRSCCAQGESASFYRRLWGARLSCGSMESSQIKSMKSIPMPAGESHSGTSRHERLPDPSVETLRGLAILLVVTLHAEAMRTGSDFAAIDFLNRPAMLIRMPLFAAISGFVYAMRPVEPNDFSDFLLGKARRLLIPMLSVGAIQYLVLMSPPFINSTRQIGPAWNLIVFPFQHLWFIQAIFWVFLVIAALERLQWLKTPFMWFVTTFAATLLLLFNSAGFSNHSPFSLLGAVYLFPFFLLGVGLSRFHNSMPRALITFIAPALLAVGIATHELVTLGVIDVPVHRTSLLAVAVGGSAIVLAFEHRRAVAWLSVLGGFSYSIFLFHLGILGVTRKILSQLGLPLAPAVEFTIGLICAVIGSILAQQVLMKTPITRRLFLGLR